MEKNIDLLNGNILTSLIELALPIMAASLVQTTYNLTDMTRIGVTGSGAVAVIGAVAMYTRLSSDVATLARMGGQVKSVHAYGEGNRGEAVRYRKEVLQLALALAAAYGIIANLFAGSLIGLFHLSSSLVVKDAIVYLRIACGFTLFALIGQTLMGLYTASDNSRIPFVTNCTGMRANIVLDPPFISGLGSIHGVGVTGVIVATVTAQFIVFLVLAVSMRKDSVLATQMWVWTPTPLSNIGAMVRTGFPAAIQSILYCGISMVLTRFVTTWGDTAVTVQRVGGQIESVLWMTADGFGTTVNAFVGQSYGTGSLKRAKKGYMTASTIMLIWGIFTTCLLILGAAPISSLPIHEPEVTPAGAGYLRIIGFSEMFMCVELMTVGALSGMGKAIEASAITIALTMTRIPLAVILGGAALGLNDIWQTLTISSIVKGITLFGYYLHTTKRMKTQVPRLICYGLTVLLYRTNL